MISSILGTTIATAKSLHKRKSINQEFVSLVNNLEQLKSCLEIPNYDFNRDDECLKKLGKISRQLDKLALVKNEGIMYGITYRYLAALTYKNDKFLFDRLKKIAFYEKEITDTSLNYDNFLTELRKKYNERLIISKKRINTYPEKED